MSSNVNFGRARLSAAALFIGIWMLWSIAFLRPVWDFDYWFQLLIGQYVWDTRSFPSREFYIYNALDEKAVFSAWGFGLYSWMAYRLGPFAASAAHALLFAFGPAMSVCGSMLLVSKRIDKAAGEESNSSCSTENRNLQLEEMADGAQTIKWLILASLAAAWAFAFPIFEDRSNFRAEATFYAMAPAGILIGIWLSRLSTVGKIMAANAAAAVLGCALANMHTTAPLLAYVSCSACFFAPGLSIRTGGRRLAMSATLGISILAGAMANPNGAIQLGNQIASGYALMAAFFDNGVWKGLSHAADASGAVTMNLEYIPAFEAGAGIKWILGMLLFMAALALRSGQRFFVVALAAPFAFMGFEHVRYVGLMSYMAAVAFSCSLSALVLSKDSEKIEAWIKAITLRKRQQARTLAVAKGIALATVCIPVIYFGVGGSVGYGVPSAWFPSKSMEWLKEHEGYKGNIFTYYHLGPYLRLNLGDGWMIPADGHFITQTASYARYENTLNGSGEYKTEFEKQSVRAVISPGTTPWIGSMVPLLFALAADPDWRLAVTEPAGMLWVKRDRPAAREDKIKDMKLYVWTLKKELEQTQLRSKVSAANGEVKKTTEFVKRLEEMLVNQ